MKKLPVGLELEATGMTWDRRKAFSRGTGGPSLACERGLEKPALGFSPALPPTCWMIQGKSLNLFELLSLNLPSQLSVGSGSVCPCFLLMEVWLGRTFPSRPERGRKAAVAQVGYEAAAKAVNIEEHGVRWTARTLETRRTLAGLPQVL